MSNSSIRSSESEDGEIDRYNRYNKRFTKERDHRRGYRDEERPYKRRHRERTPEEEFIPVSDEEHNSSVGEELEEEYEYEEEDDVLDETHEEGLEIKPPQHRVSHSSSSRHRESYRDDKSSSSVSHRLPKESPLKQHKDKDRHRSRYQETTNKSSGSKSGDDYSRHRQRDEDIDIEISGTSSRSKSLEKPSKRWMVLDEERASSENKRSAGNKWNKMKGNEQQQTSSSSSSHRLSHRHSHSHHHHRDKEFVSSSDRDRYRKTSPKIDDKNDEIVATETATVSSSTSKQLAKKYKAMIEVQEVEMSEEEIVSEEQNTNSERSNDRTKSDVSDHNRADLYEDIDDDDVNDDIDDQEEEEEEVVVETVTDNKVNENPRIVIEEEVVYYSESNAVNNSRNCDDLTPNNGVVGRDDLPDYFPAIQGCRSVEEFQCINRIEEGTYGVVYRARDKRTNETVALKRLKMEKEKEGFPITSLREISTLLKAQHENIVTVREIVVGSNMDKIYIVMEFVEHDLKSLMETMKQPFLLGEVKTLMQQLLRAVAHLHDNWILHRDLKTSNLLLSHRGILKVGDFGLAREYGSPLKPYTPIVVTLWYRAPELLLQTKQYSYPIDIWSVGCIFGELLTMKPLFPGKSEIDQLNAIFKDLGTPNDKIWPNYSDLPLVKKVNFANHPYNNMHNRLNQKLTKLGFDLLNRFLTYCPDRRITAEDALKHDFFKESPLPVDPSMFPTWPAKSEQSANAGVRKAHSPKPPSGGKQFAKQLGDDGYEKLMVTDSNSQGFHMTLPDHGKASKGGGFSLRF